MQSNTVNAQPFANPEAETAPNGQPKKRVYVFMEAVPEEELLADLEGHETQVPVDGEDTIEQDTVSPLVTETAATPKRALVRRRRPVLVLALLLTFLLLTGVTGSLAYVFFFQTVTVTIVPDSRSIAASGTITIVTGAADASQNQLPARLLPPQTISQTLTQATTGITNQLARPGRGTITLYNAALYPQTVPESTLITAQGGMQVVTDYTVTVPPGTLATNGQATVTAHSVIAGSAGNIKADDIYGDCCLLKISAVNSVFTGGQDAATYQSVAQQDIDTAAASLKTDLTQAITAALQSQVPSSETLVTPPTCQPTITTDPGPGEKATQVQVTESLSCTGITYKAALFQQLLQQLQYRAAQQQGGNQYRLTGMPRATIVAVNPGNDAGTEILTVQTTGVWVYHFSQGQLNHLAGQIAGKDTTQATRVLLHTAGIHRVSWSTGGMVPSDAGRIHMLLVVPQ